MYVQFREEEHAANVLRNLTGRYYAGYFKILAFDWPYRILLQGRQYLTF